MAGSVTPAFSNTANKRAFRTELLTAIAARICEVTGATNPRPTKYRQLLAFASSTPAPTRTNNVYVDGIDGDDGGSGDITEPFFTIDTAIAFAEGTYPNGDFAIFLSGTEYMMNGGVNLLALSKDDITISTWTGLSGTQTGRARLVAKYTNYTNTGWTSDGSGVYHRTIGYTPSFISLRYDPSRTFIECTVAELASVSYGWNYNSGTNVLTVKLGGVAPGAANTATALRGYETDANAIVSGGDRVWIENIETDGVGWKGDGTQCYTFNANLQTAGFRYVCRNCVARRGGYHLFGQTGGSGSELGGFTTWIDCVADGTDATLGGDPFNTHTGNGGNETVWLNCVVYRARMPKSTGRSSWYDIANAGVTYAANTDTAFNGHTADDGVHFLGMIASIKCEVKDVEFGANGFITLNSNPGTTGDFTTPRIFIIHPIIRGKHNKTDLGFGRSVWICPDVEVDVPAKDYAGASHNGNQHSAAAHGWVMRGRVISPLIIASAAAAGPHYLKCWHTDFLKRMPQTGLFATWASLFFYGDISNGQVKNCRFECPPLGIQRTGSNLNTAILQDFGDVVITGKVDGNGYANFTRITNEAGGDHQKGYASIDANYKKIASINTAVAATPLSDYPLEFGADWDDDVDPNDAMIGAGGTDVVVRSGGGGFSSVVHGVGH